MLCWLKKWGTSLSLPPEINDHLHGVQCSYSCMQPCDQAQHCGVISKLDQPITFACRLIICGFYYSCLNLRLLTLFFLLTRCILLGLGFLLDWKAGKMQWEYLQSNVVIRRSIRQSSCTTSFPVFRGAQRESGQGVRSCVLFTPSGRGDLEQAERSVASFKQSTKQQESDLPW